MADTIEKLHYVRVLIGNPARWTKGAQARYLGASSSATGPFFEKENHHA